MPIYVKKNLKTIYRIAQLHSIMANLYVKEAEIYKLIISYTQFWDQGLIIRMDSIMDNWVFFSPRRGSVKINSPWL